MDAQFEMAMALRKSHCDRKGQDHECVGEVTIKRGEVCLNCPLCGSGSHIDGWNSVTAQKLAAIFNAAGIDWLAIAFDRQLEAIKAFSSLADE